MNAEPSGNEERSVYRPLPSVDLPLLPEHRRAIRLRRVLLATLFGVITLGAIGVLAADRYWPELMERLNGEGTLATATTASLDQESVAVAVATTDAGDLSSEALAKGDPRQSLKYTTQFGKAPSFHAALRNAGLDDAECLEIENALRHTIDFRRCLPTHRLVVERDENARLLRFEYHPSNSEFVKVTRDADQKLTAERVSFPIKKTRVVKAGSVETSLREGLESVGLHGGLSGVFVEAFEGRINFGTDTRKGDVFRIIVDEEKVRGEFYRYGRIHALDYHSARRGKLRAYYHAIPGEVGQFHDSTGRAMHGGWLRTPLRYDRISSRFNPRRRHPILKRIVPHTGVDYAASLGTPVWAAANGTVKFAGRKGANGNLVSIRHHGGFESHYAHLHRIQSGIKKGARVTQRQSLGVVGSTGRSTGPHLHFALKKRGRFVDPQKELNGPGLRMASKQNAIFKKKIAPIAIELDALEANGPQPVEPPTDAAPPEIDEAMD